MAVPPLSATGAYSAISRLGVRGDAASTAATQGTQGTQGAGGSFAGMVRDVASQAIGSMRNAEQASVRAVSGQGGDLNNVVMAVANAEVTLQTAVAVRDRVIQAYMDIVRMPI